VPLVSDPLPRARAPSIWKSPGEATKPIAGLEMSDAAATPIHHIAAQPNTNFEFIQDHLT
jgi:hypothetical protein